jgi:hypothetical protein
MINIGLMMEGWYGGSVATGIGKILREKSVR